MMKIGDLVRCRPRSEDENYDEWLGLIIGEPSSSGVTVAVQWVCSDIVWRELRQSITQQELWRVNESR